MERPTSGRRYTRAGSVPVAELIKKRRVSVPVSGYDNALTRGTGTVQQQTEERGQPHTHRLHTVRPGSLVRAAGLSVAAVVFCASFGAAALIDRRRGESPPLTVQPMVESGAQDMLPTLFNIGPQNAPTGGSRAQATDGTTAVTPTLSNTANQDMPRQADVEEPNEPPTVQSPSTDSTTRRPAESKADTVRRFYELVRQQPARAAQLLAHMPPTSVLAQFVNSWTSVGQINLVGVQERQDGLVATITMVLPDAHVMRVQQLLRLTDEQPPRIQEAKVISAQRS